MATIKVSGTRVQTPQGTTNLSAPNGEIIISTTVTNIAGAVNIAGNTFIANTLTVGQQSTLTGQVTILSNIHSTSTTTGGLVVLGGVGIGESVFVGSNTNIQGYLNVGSVATITGTLEVKGLLNTATTATTGIVIKPNSDNVGNPVGVLYTNTNVYDTAAHRQLGAVYINGGLGVEKDLNVGGFIYGRIAQATTSINYVVTTTNADQTFYPTFAQFTSTSTQTTYSANYVDNLSSGTNTSTGGLTYNPYRGLLSSDQIAVAAQYNSTSTNTGALTVAGGAGIAQDVHVGGKAYAEAIYTNLLASTEGNINIKPAGQYTDIFSDIRVRGANPLGTGPVVTNVLYVTMDGDDTNDGRAMDPTRACRTIGGAMKSPYYQTGTQIRVSPGHYFENNPLVMKPYTSVMGSDIRTTEIEPINKTQDLFHVNSGCYLAFMQFCQGRSGLLPGNYYTNGYNRGAYATAFPPDQKIDLFHSPYIQNCTNLSGPWLKDASLFQPDQTVQVPIAVGTATWSANTTSIVVTLDNSISTGTIQMGMSVNQGPQNEGFFDARTLLLANIPFLQSQVVSFVEQQFNSGSFTYDSNKCARDTGLIIDAISLDLLYQGNTESTFAGLQYWNQDVGFTGLIAQEISTLTNAIIYLQTLVQNTATIVDPSGNSTNYISNLFNGILNILSNGPADAFGNGVTNNFITPSLPSTDTTIVSVYNTLIEAIPSLQQQTLDYLASTDNGFVFDQTTCARDMGYIVQSVAFDLLTNSNWQTLKSGVYYFGYDVNSTAIPNEIPQTTVAYNYIKTILPNIVNGVKLSTQYSSATQIINGYNPGTSYEVATLQNSIDTITRIITNGPSVAGEKTPITYNEAQNVEVLNAYRLLQANKSFIQSEVIAFIDSQFNNFNYNKELCYRDVGILVENVSYDATFGGNAKSSEAGQAYWDGVVSVIAGQESQTAAAINYLEELCQQVITNTTATVLPPVYGIFQGTQVRNTALTNGAVASSSIKTLFNLISDIVQNGPPAVPVSFVTSAADAAFESAQVLLQLNRTFIQEDTINWINNTFQAFPYNKVKCKRDIGVILDSVIEDVLFPTTGFSQSTFAGLQYYSQNTDTQAIIPNEINQTIDAVTYLKSLSAKIVQNITPSVDLVQRYQTAVAQVTNLEAATSAEATSIGANFDYILSILKGQTTGWTDLLEFGFTKSQYISVQNAYALLQANKSYLAAEVIAYINATNPGFSTTYNQATCARDVGYIIDCICFDLLYSGNKQSIQAGLSYYGFIGTASNIVNETTQTVAAYNFMSNLVSEVVQNIPAIPLSGATQNLVAAPAVTTTATIDLFAQAFSTITNIIANGPSVAADLSPISLVANTATDTYNALTILQANKDFITSEVLQFIDNTFNAQPYSYNTSTCYRDTGLIVDSIAIDMLYDSISESTFAGLQYWNQSGLTGIISSELSTTTAAISFASSLTVALLTDSSAISIVSALFNQVNDLINNGTSGVTDSIISNGLPSTTSTIVQSYNTIQSNIASIQNQTIAWINGTYPTFAYNQDTCKRDIGYILNSVSFDLLHGGNKQSIKSGVYYYAYNSNSSQVATEISEVSAAYDFVADLIRYVVTAQPAPRVFQTAVTQTTTLPAATMDEVGTLQGNINTIVNIIDNGPSVAGPKIPIGQTMDTNPNVLNAYNLLMANRTFIQEETLAFINQAFVTNTSFTYNEELCYRDTGLIVDAVSQDILLGGNAKSIEAGKAYWNQGYNYVTGQETTTTMAINHARDLAISIIANQPVIAQPQTETKQIINPFYSYGSAYMPKQAVARCFNIITTIIERGPLYAPEEYPGSGFVNATGPNALDIQISPVVTSIENLGGNKYLVEINTSTVGFGNNATLYFGDTYIWPLQDYQVEAIALQYTGSTSTWDMRKVDPIGGMGGSLVDGAVISDRSPIQSFVYDAFTQLTQGGRGVHITNNGYAQLVSVFTIFSSVGVQVDNGGIASIVNSNANFGDICLLAKGYGTRKFSGTVYNPAYVAYPFSPGPSGLNQYYPQGYWPNNSNVEIFISDPNDRPHISLVMEVVPPENYINYAGEIVPYTNSQGFPGFLNAQPSTSTLTTGSISINNIDVTGIAVGNSVYITDQFGYTYDSFPYVHDEFGRALDIHGRITTNVNEYVTNTNYLIPYAATGTVVADVNYQSVTLNYALPTGGGFDDNPNYFTLYFCGNAYYTVLSSTTATNPYVTGTNILSVANPNITVDQVEAHINALTYLNELVDNVIGNVPVRSIQTGTQTSVQTFLPTVTGGANASTFIDQRFSEMVTIIGANSGNYNTIIPSNLISKTGTLASGAGSAVSLIKANIDFLADEVVSFVDVLTNTSTFTYNQTTCARDLGYILDGTYYDVALGTNYNAVTSGLAYTRGTAVNVTATELVATINAFDFAQQQAAQALASNSTAVARSTAAFDEIKNILANGTTVANVISFPAPSNAPTHRINAVNQLTANKSFIQAEVLAWIAANYSYLTFNTDLCSRDVGYLVDALCYDIMYGGNSASLICANAYFDIGGNLVIGGSEQAPTSAAYYYLSQIAQQIVLGQTVTPTAGNSLTQNQNGAYGTTTEASVVSTNLAIIYYAIENAQVPATTTVYPDTSWVDSSIMSADNYLAGQQDTIINETINYINLSFNTNGGSNFTYNTETCYRDAGLIVDGLAMDLLFGGNSQSTFAGIQYWNQNTGYVGAIASEITTTTQAINYLSSLAQKIVTNDTSGTRYQNTVTQVTNLTSATNAEAALIANEFTVITNILSNGTAGITDSIIPNGTTASADTNIQHAVNLLQANLNYMQAEVIAYVNYIATPGFTYSTSTCSRDVGYMIDSVCVDIQYPNQVLGASNRQAIQCGVYYYGYNSTSTAIPNEIPETIAAYDYMRRLVSYVITGSAVPAPYQTGVSQVTNLPTGTNSQVTAVQNNIDVITGIISNGPTGVTKTPIGVTASSDQSVKNAVALLEANRTFIQAEVVAYTNTIGGQISLTPSQRLKCRRDVQITLQRLIYDLESGGNYNSVQVGLSYWGQDGTHHIVSLGENVTNAALFPDGATVNFYQRSYISASGYVFEYVGAGTNYGALPQFGVADPIQTKETVQLDTGKVFFTSTDQNGDFRIGPGLVISQATGVLSGRTFTKSLFANLTPFILAIEGGGTF
jgi:hypothetical protein